MVPIPESNDDEDEADLDVQWSGAVAKGATIDFVVSETTETTPGIDLSALYIIDNNLAPVMSESYGACEAELGAGGNQFYSTLWEQAAAQGITVLMAAGDSGSAGCDRVVGETAAQYGLAVSGFASTPFNVAVGGTDFNDASSIAYVLESDERFPLAVLCQILYSREHLERFLRGLRAARLRQPPPPAAISVMGSIWLPAAVGPAVVRTHRAPSPTSLAVESTPNLPGRAERACPMTARATSRTCPCSRAMA